MKTALLLSLMTIALATSAEAKSIIGRVDSYIIAKTGVVVEIGTNEIEDDRSTATFYSYPHRKKITVNMSDLSKSTKAEIANVKAGENVLINTQSASGKVITRECVVFHLFENKQAFVGCKTYEADKTIGYQTPDRLDYVVQNVEEGAVAEVDSIQNVSKGDILELRVETKTIKANKKVRVLAVFANGDAIVEPQLAKLNFLNSSGIYRYGVEKVRLQDLN